MNYRILVHNPPEDGSYNPCIKTVLYNSGTAEAPKIIELEFEEKKIRKHDYYISDFDQAGDQKVMACFEHISTGLVACADPKK